MSKMRIAFESFAESLAYMAMALLTFFAGQFMPEFLPWWVYLIGCIVLCLLMAWLNYMGKVYGFGFDEEDEDDEE